MFVLCEADLSVGYVPDLLSSDDAKDPFLAELLPTDAPVDALDVFVEYGLLEFVLLPAERDQRLDVAAEGRLRLLLGRHLRVEKWRAQN